MHRSQILKIVAVLILVCGTLYSFADVLITDFFETNPLSAAYPGSSWTNQFQSFTDGDVSGQEVLSLNGGSPTASGGAWCKNLTLDLSGTSALTLTARLLSGNEALNIQVLLSDADGTTEKFNFSTAVFNTTTFTSSTTEFSSRYLVATGTTSGLDLSNISLYEIQGNYYDGTGGDAPFNIQFDNLSATVIPEPASAQHFIVGALPAVRRHLSC